MVGVVNPPSDAQNGTLDAYKKAASAFSGTPADAAAAFGGVAVSNTASAPSTPSSTSSGGSGPYGNSPSNTGAGGSHVGAGGLLGAVGVAFYALV